MQTEQVMLTYAANDRPRFNGVNAFKDVEIFIDY